MKDFKVEFSVILSPYAYKFYKKVTKGELISFLKDFSKIVDESRYRDFFKDPHFYTDSFGRRRAIKARHKKKYHEVTFDLPVEILDSIKKLQSMGHSLSWIVEEALYYGLRKK